MYSDRSYSPVTGNRGRRSKWRGQMFYWKLVNKRFCACAVKNRPKTRFFVLSNRQNFCPFMGNRSRWTRRYINQI